MSRCGVNDDELERKTHELYGDVAKQDSEIERLRAIVDRLPTTADGVPVTPGMQVWDREYGERHYAWHFLRIEHGIGIASKSVGVVVLSECYSTREAAQAAGGAK